jgi:predicted CxxxxCH...CXXCH cytochrome family protein
MRTPLVLVLAVACVGCLERRPDDRFATPSECTACHGSPGRQGTEVERAAPPVDTEGNDSVDHPGVGAHEIHLNASATHAAVACEQCHVVPATVTAPGHLDTPPPADVVFGALARSGGHDAARYDPVAHTCTDVYCHGASTPAWTSPKSSDEACGTCHALPPPPPHTEKTPCSLCHAAVVGPDDRTIVSPALHVNGRVDLPATLACDTCHGSPESPAPPPALNGYYDVTYRGVGAHQTHLANVRITTMVQCTACHVVPTDVLSPGHIDTPPAEVTFSGRAVLESHQPAWDGTSCANTYCHDPGSGQWGGENVAPIWTESGQTYCGSCHGLPPPPPHPGRPEGGLSVCADCHSNLTRAEEFVDLSKHINGTIDF